MKLAKYFIFVLIAFVSLQAYSQRDKKKGGQYVITVNPGIAYGEASNSYTSASFYGPHFSVGVRKRVIKLSKNYNFSGEWQLGSQLAFIDIDGTQKLSGYQVMQFLFNFNGLAGSYPPSKKAPITFPVGFFIGPGIYAARGGNAKPTDPTNNLSQKNDPLDLGPMINLGARFKMSKTYFFDFKLFAAFTVFNEMAIGGVTLQFPIMLRKTSGGK